MKPNTLYIGIDPSMKSTGIALYTPGSEHVHASARPLIDVGEYLDDVKSHWESEWNGVRIFVAIEAPARYRSGVITNAAAFAIQRGIKSRFKKAATIIMIVPQQWRKSILGSGKADKQAAINYAKIVAKIHTDNNDIAEAVCIAYYAKAMDV